MLRASLLFLIVCLGLFAAGMAGTYKGSWNGAGGGGDFKIVLTPGDGDSWKADVTFTFDGDEIKTKVTSVKVDGSKLEVVYTFELGGNQLQSKVTGALTDKTIEGSYVTTAVADGSGVDQGTWKTAATE